MILPDVNLLLYAHNQHHPFRTRSAAWWSRCLSGDETVFLCTPVLFGFIRIATSGRAAPNPITVQQAATLINEWLERPNVEFADIHMDDVHQALALLLRTGVAGNLTTDAQIAALSLRLGAVVHTADADFGRFNGVRWHNPLSVEREK